MKKNEEKIIVIKDGYRHTTYTNNPDRTLVELDMMDITTKNIDNILKDYCDTKSSTTFPGEDISVDMVDDYIHQLVLDNGLWVSTDMNKDCEELKKRLKEDINRLVIGGLSEINKWEVTKIISNHYKKLYKSRKLK